MSGNQDTMAQEVFLAQLEAAKGACKCNTCRILRRASTMMTAQFLGPTPEPALHQDAVTDALQAFEGEEK